MMPTTGSMMRRAGLLLGILAVLLVPVPAPGASSAIRSFEAGGQAIRYAIPEGYVEAMSGPHGDFFRHLRSMFPKDQSVVALLASREADEAVRQSRALVLSEYSILCYPVPESDQTFSPEAFQARAQREVAAMRQAMDGLDEAAGKALGSTLQVVARLEDRWTTAHVLPQASSLESPALLCLFSMIRVQGKLVYVYQYKLVDNEDELEAYLAGYADILEAFAFGPLNEPAEPTLVDQALNLGHHMLGPALAASAVFLFIRLVRRIRERRQRS